MTSTTEWPDLLTVRELAAYLRVSLRTAYQLVADGEVQATRVGGQWRISRAALDSQFEAPGRSRPAGGDE
jgi:excisionase family DNA binding protein